MSTVIIPARYASSRFIGKALALIGGTPMVNLVAQRCLQSKADRVVVVTDDERIAEAVRTTRAECVMSPSELATGTDRVAYVAKNINDDIVINVQGDEPIIPPSRIDEWIAELERDPSLEMITACVAFKDEAMAQNPSHVKVVMDSNGNALYFSRLPIPFDRDGNINPIRYRHIGIYGFRRKFLLRYAQLGKTPLEQAESLEQLRALENGVRIKVIKTAYEPVSVDTPEDLVAAEQYSGVLHNG
ncbi:MAG: 3-deoxy-manno-octulosonate cytidylyltransferase [Deferribacteraceae bacterium]|jgi:3-deoxy-manno-octulosonate cytidylyltransferase (CMP-KDO synthetase)|nr:3-deoxy-manno-octulosonate cytidylyltransferase [Deferribacteraceae bacterium]